MPALPELVKDIKPGVGDSNPFLIRDPIILPSIYKDPIVLGSKLVFDASDSINGRELWVTDGTTDGTQLLKDIFPGSSSGAFSEIFPDNLTVFDGKLFFSADDGINGNELWISDGTTDGTQLFKDIYPGFTSSYPTNLTVFDGKLFFSARDGLNGTELWVSDGTAAGTQLFKKTKLNGFPNVNPPTDLTVVNGKLFFSADDGVNGRELWVSDGTVAGTQLLKNINLGGGSDPNTFIAVGSKLFFNADDGITGSEVWVSDGTADGTRLVKDIVPGNTHFSPLGRNPTARDNYGVA